MTINNIVISLCSIVILILAINLYIASNKIKSISDTVDEINIMLKDFNNG